MARIVRKDQRIFAGSASNNGQFGSAQAGTQVTSNDLDVLQQLDAWASGWNSATISSQRLPTLEEMQGIQYVLTSQVAYLFQEGIPEFLLAAEYHQNSIVKKPGTYELYGSIIDDNTGNALPSQADNTEWQYLGDLAELVNIGGSSEQVMHVQDEKTAGTDAGTFTNGVDRTRDLNTVVENTIVGASLAANQITLTEDGVYEVRAFVPAYDVDGHTAHLFDVTNGTRLVQGKSAYANANQTDSVIVGTFTVSGDTTIEIRHRSENTQAGNGFGRTISDGGEAIYTDITLTRRS